MLAIILFSIYLAPLKAVEMQQSLQQIVKGPMTYVPPAPYLPRVLSPLIPPAYITKTDHTGYKVPMESENCPNSEVLQNVLRLLNRLLTQEDISQIEDPKVQLENIALLKKYIQFKKSQNGDNIKQKDRENVPIFEFENDENSTSPIKGEFVLKYDIPNTSCKDAINDLMQTLYNVNSRLNFSCEQTGKCSFQSHSQELPSILIDSFPIPPKYLYSNKISNGFPYFSDPQNQISLYQASPEINFHLNHAPLSNNFQLKKIPSNGKGIYQDNINDYNMLLEEFMKINKPENKDSERDNFFTEQSNAMELNKQERPRIPYVSNLAINYVPKNILSFDESLKGFQDLNSKLAGNHASAIVNKYKQINLNKHLSPPFQQHMSLDLQALNGNLFNAPENLLQLNQRPEIEIYSKDPIFGNIGSSQIEISKLLAPNIQEMSLKPVHVNHQDAQIVNHESDVNYKGYPIQSMNPQAPSYFPDYLRQDAYGSKLLDSQHAASVHNLDKLNLASDNNGIVELTYMLRKLKPSFLPSFTKRYYYVKYRLPYRAFKNPDVKSNPSRIYEQLLSASNLAEVSPDLRHVGNDELTKLIKEGGVLVDAKVLPVSHSKTDKYLKTIQKLNAQLNTNEILNLVENGTKGKNDVTDPSIEYKINLKPHKLNDKELSSKTYLDPSLIRLFSSNPYFANINRNYLPNSLPNSMAMNSIQFTALPINNINPRVIYDTAINLQPFAPRTSN